MTKMPVQHRRMSMFAKLCIGALALLLTVILVPVILIGTPYFSAKLGTLLTHKSGRNIALQGKIEAHLWSREPHFIIRGVKVGNAEWGSEPLMFEADRIAFSIRLFPLFKGEIILPELSLDHPKLLLEKNAKGDANWNFSQNPQTAVLKQPLPQKRSEMPIISHLAIVDGKVTYHDPAKNIMTSIGISTVQGHEGGAADSINIHGKGSYQNQPFLLEVGGASVLQLRESNSPYPFTLKTTLGKTSVEAKGTVQDPVKLEKMDINLSIKGENAADIYAFTGIALPPTQPYALSGELTKEGEDWKFNHFAGKMGHSDLNGNLTWHAAQKPPYFQANFISNNLDIADLGAFVGTRETPKEDERVIPDTSLDISRLLSMNADVTFHGAHIKEPQVIDDFYLKVALKDGVLKLEPVSFGIAKGKISTNITIEGRKNPPAVSLTTDFRHLSLNQLFAPLAKSFGKENVSAGELGGKASIGGAGKSLREILANANGSIGIGVEGGELSHLLLDLMGLDIFRSAGMVLSGQDNPVAINCIVGDFIINNGLMQPRTFLIDTAVTTVRGEGDINLKNENLNLRLHVYPKESTLISARSPLLIKGTFKHPSFGVDPVALAERGGIAAALAVLAPPAAILAFIGPGLGEESHCATYVKQLDHDIKVGAQKHPQK